MDDDLTIELSWPQRPGRTVMNATKTDQPLGLSLSEGLGRVVPERAAFDKWQADSAPELWENNRASLGGTAWATWVAAKEDARRNMEFVGWQKRLTHPVYGAESWAFCDGSTADALRGRPGYEVRPVYATRPNNCVQAPATE